MPTLDSSNIESVNFINCEKKTMESGSNGSGEDQKEIDYHSNSEPFFLTNELIEKESSSVDENTMIKVKLTEDSIPILQLSPERSENLFASDDDEVEGASCISPSPEAYGTLKTTLIPSTPTRHSPSSNLSENSNGNAVGINTPNYSKTSFNRQITISKRITFSQDSVSQLDTPVATINEISDFLNRNLEIPKKNDPGHSLKRSFNLSKVSSSEGSEIESVKLPKRKKETLSNEEDTIPKSPIRVKSRSRSCSPQLKDIEENSKEPKVLKEPQPIDNLDNDVDDIHLYLSGTIKSLTTSQTEKINSEAKDDMSSQGNTKLDVITAIEEPSPCQFLETTDEATTEKPKFQLKLTDVSQDTDVQLNPTPITSVFAKVQTTTEKEKKIIGDSRSEKSLLFESTFTESDSAILTEDSNVSGGLENSSFKASYSESREINKNSAQSNTRFRNRILDTPDISLGLLTQSPIPISQKRAHSSDENEPKKNLKTRDTQTPEFDSSQELSQNHKMREKIVKQLFRDYFDANGTFVKSMLVNEEVISEHYRSHSSLSYHSSLTSGELADHSSSLPLSKSTTTCSSTENLNVTVGSSVASNSEKLDRSKASSITSLDPTPPTSKLPISAKKVLTLTSSSSTSEENLFKTPKTIASKLKWSNTPKRKTKETIAPVSVLEGSGVSSPEIPVLKTLKPQTEEIPSDPTAIYPGVRVLAKWGDGYYYPGKVGNQKSNEKWEVKFDDGSLRAVKNQAFFNAALIKRGQSVLATSDNGEYFDSGVIVESFKDEKEEGYVVDFDKGFTKKVTREKVILSGAQVQAIITPVSPILSTKLFGPELNLDNIVDGKRRRTPTGKTTLIKSRRDPLLDSTETESSTSTESDSKSTKNVTKSLSRGRKKLTPKNTPNSKMPELVKEQNVNVTPEKSPRLNKKPSTEEETTDSTPKSTSSITRQYDDSNLSPELRRLGQSPPKRTQRTKRSLDQEFDQLVSIIPEEKSSIFRGLYFLISCADRCSYRNYDSSSSYDGSRLSPNTEIMPFNKEYLIKVLELGGGRVLQNFEDIQNVSLKKVFLISNTYLRTLKYIKCLASGIPCILFEWVLYSVKQKKRLNYSSYILPAGYSIIDKEIIQWHGRNTILKGLHILLISRNNPMFLATWKPVLLAAQAETVHRMTNDKSPHSSLVNVIVSDQSCPSHIIRRANDLSIPIVSSEWVIQCLINGKKLPFNTHERFDYMYDEN